MVNIQGVVNRVNGELLKDYRKRNVLMFLRKFISSFDVDAETGNIGNFVLFSIRDKKQEIVQFPPHPVWLSDALLLIEKFGNFKRFSMKAKRQMVQQLSTDGRIKIADLIEIFLNKAFVFGLHYTRYNSNAVDAPIPENGVLQEYKLFIPRELMHELTPAIRNAWKCIMGNIPMVISDSSQHPSVDYSFYVNYPHFGMVEDLFGLKIPSFYEVEKILAEDTEKIRKIRLELELQGFTGHSLIHKIKDENGKKIGIFHEDIKNCVTEETSMRIKDILGG